MMIEAGQTLRIAHRTTTYTVTGAMLEDEVKARFPNCHAQQGTIAVVGLKGKRGAELHAELRTTKRGAYWMIMSLRNGKREDFDATDITIG